jgi:hypothetical protein
MAASQIRMRSNLSSEMQRKKKNATLLQVALHFFVPALKCIRLRVQCQKKALMVIQSGPFSALFAFGELYCSTGSFRGEYNSKLQCIIFT